MKRGNRIKICIICEGYEEVDYINSLKSKAVFSQKYEFITVNAKSINNIYSRYTDKYQSDSYSLVLVFCDTDKKPYLAYKKIKNDINNFHGRNVADSIVIFGNPCTLQIFISHFVEIKVKSQSKITNSKYIKEFLGIDNYKATQEQRKELFAKVKRENYLKMKHAIAKLSKDENIVSSTNILEFFEKFEMDDASWIEEINQFL